MCIKRGTFPSDKRDGRLYALLEIAPTRDPTDRTDELIDELRDRVQSLEGQLQAERQARAEARRIIAGLVERIPALEAPQEPPEAQETVEDEPEAAGLPPARCPWAAGGRTEPLVAEGVWAMSVVSLLFILVVILVLATAPLIVINLISRGRLPVVNLIPLFIGVVVVILFLTVIMVFVLSGLIRG